MVSTRQLHSVKETEHQRVYKQNIPERHIHHIITLFLPRNYNSTNKIIIIATLRIGYDYEVNNLIK